MGIVESKLTKKLPKSVAHPLAWLWWWGSWALHMRSGYICIPRKATVLVMRWAVEALSEGQTQHGFPGIGLLLKDTINLVGMEVCGAAVVGVV